MSSFLGVDLGAESGRVLLGELEGNSVTLEEVHRFPNVPVRLHDTLVWDLPRLFHEVCQGLGRGAARARGAIRGIGCDSWGVDFGLLDRRGGVLTHPVHYRDARTREVFPRVVDGIGRGSIYRETGIQFLELNTLVQLAALRERSPEILERSGKLLLMADLIHYLLCGRAASEASLASTTQLWSPVTRTWSPRILESLGLPVEIFPEVVEAGAALGTLRPEVAREVGLSPSTPVLAPAAHDTGSAVAAVPAAGTQSWAYLSSGTWSLLGVELSSPNLSDGALRANFTNEAGAARTTRFLKNLTGLWLVQECRKSWSRDGASLEYAELAREADAAGPARAWVNPGDPAFFAPPDMPTAVLDFCRHTGQPLPGTRGEMVRLLLESLALSYRHTLEQVQAVTGVRVERLHVVGGGSRNDLLNRLTAGATGLPVIAGPVEATGLGNILLQALGSGELRNMGELRDVVARSSRTTTCEPGDSASWAERYDAFRRILPVERAS